MTNGDLVTTTSPTSDGTAWSLLTAEQLAAQADSSTTFSVAMNLFCNPDADTPTMTSNIWNVANFTYIISYDTKHGNFQQSLFAEFLPSLPINYFGSSFPIR